MNYSYIEQLVARYWDGLTTEEEEQILRSFFSQADVPDHLKSCADHFAAMEHLRHCTLGNDFDERLLARIGETESAPVVQAQPISFYDHIRPYCRAAAAVAIVALLAGSVEHAITHSAAENQTPTALVPTTDDSVTPRLETLNPVQPVNKTASADSIETILLY